MEKVTFKCEDSLWRMLADGSKTFDMRKHDLGDERIFALSWSRLVARAGELNTASSRLARTMYIKDWYEYQVKKVEFVNKQTNEHICFEYKGMEFEDWAPGWCFLKLGKACKRVET